MMGGMAPRFFAAVLLTLASCSTSPDGADPLLAGDAAPPGVTPGRAPNEPGAGPDAAAGVSCANFVAWSTDTTQVYYSGYRVTYGGHLWSCGTASLCNMRNEPPPGRAWADLGPCLPTDAGPVQVDARPSSSSPDAGAGDARPAKLVDCGTNSEWAPKTAFGLHERARHLGQLFECTGDPPYRSQCLSSTYEPGKPGGPWAEAWLELGTCR
jgi:hypothetical protein